MTPETVFFLFLFALLIGLMAFVTWLCEDVLGWHFDIVDTEGGDE